MRSDIARWEKKYRRSDPESFLVPNGLLAQHAKLLCRRGLALDLAAGKCHASIQLAKLGNHVISVDCSLTALKLGQKIANREAVQLHGLVADLDYWPFPASAFDIIVCMHYLNRDLFSYIENALRPGGLLIYKTFNHNYLQIAPTFNKKYVLQKNELSESFSKLEIIASSDGATKEEPYSFLIARLPDLRHA